LLSGAAKPGARHAQSWKPGSNFSVRIGADAGRAAPLPGGVAVRDAWDGSVRDVRIEVLEEGRPARPMTDAEREQMSFRVSVRPRVVGRRGVERGREALIGLGRLSEHRQPRSLCRRWTSCHHISGMRSSSAAAAAVSGARDDGSMARASVCAVGMGYLGQVA
jgi:hypothetical protein